MDKELEQMTKAELIEYIGELEGRLESMKVTHRPVQPEPKTIIEKENGTVVTNY